MESLIRDTPSSDVYIDDILVTDNTLDASLENLEQVLRRLKKENCIFAEHEVVFLGNKISKFVFKPMNEKVQTVMEAKPPWNVQQLEAYLGLLDYYWCFVRTVAK